MYYQKEKLRDFPHGPEVKNSPSNAGVAGSIPSGGTSCPAACGILSPRAATRSPHATTREAHAPQLESSPRAATREKTACHNEDPVQPKKKERKRN